MNKGQEKSKNEFTAIGKNIYYLFAGFVVFSFLAGLLGGVVYTKYILKPMPKFYTFDFTKVLVHEEKLLSKDKNPQDVKAKIDRFVSNIKKQVKIYNKKGIIVVSQAVIKGSKYTKNITKTIEGKVEQPYDAIP